MATLCSSRLEAGVHTTTIEFLALTLYVGRFSDTVASRALVPVTSCTTAVEASTLLVSFGLNTCPAFPVEILHLPSDRLLGLIGCLLDDLHSLLTIQLFIAQKPNI